MEIKSKLTRLACAAAILLVCMNTGVSGAPQGSLSTATPEWSVVVVESGLDTIWVDLSYPNAGAGSDTCIAGMCSVEEFIYCDVTPCPLAHMEYGCYNNVASGGLNPNGGSVRFGLQPAVTYTISGVYERIGDIFDHSGDCIDPVCFYNEYPPDLVYTAVPVATATTTWGKIKALYQ